jgi:pimeloyl-ACP methyl ester carboxylesterase
MEPFAWRAPELGDRNRLDLSHGPLDYFRLGTGPVLVFAHGWLTNANLWRRVAARLANEFTCVVPDLPLGSHLAAMRPEFDGTPHSVAGVINDLIDALGLRRVVLVGNDSGGAYSQIAAAARPERVVALVLTACETPYDPFPPEPFQVMRKAARTTDGLFDLLSPLRDPAVRALPTAFGGLTMRALDERVSDSYALPALELPPVLRDATRVVASADQGYVATAGRTLISEFTGPVAFLWPTGDTFFSLDNARRYAGELRDGYVELIGDSRAFTPEDQPARLADLIRAAATRTPPAP